MCALHSPNRRENQLGNSFDLSSKTSLEIRPTCRENQLGNPSELSRKSALKFVRFVQKIGLEIRPIVEKINHSLEIRPICWEKKQFWNCSDLSKKTAWKFARLSGKSAWKFVRLSRKWKIVRFVEKISLEFRPIVETISLSRQSACRDNQLGNSPDCRENHLGNSSDCRENPLRNSSKGAGCVILLVIRYIPVTALYRCVRIDFGLALLTLMQPINTDQPNLQYVYIHYARNYFGIELGCLSKSVH